MLEKVEEENSNDVSCAIEQIVQEEVEQEEQVEQYQKPVRKWTNSDQATADNSEIAKAINKGLYYLMTPFCKNKQLREEHVADPNVGGSIVALMIYYGLALTHPAILLVVRVVLLYGKFRQVCNKMIEEVKDKIERYIPGQQYDLH